MYTVETRSLTPEESSRLADRSTLSLQALIFLLFLALLSGAAGYGIGRFVEWVTGMFGATVGPCVSWSLGAATGAAVLAWLLRRLVSGMRAWAERIRDGSVEVIHVDNARAVRVGPPDDEAPCVVLDIGNGKLLFLIGQWMSDPHVFSPYASDQNFPTQSFILHRVPDIGEVLKVEIKGKPMGRLLRVTLEETGLTKYPIETFRESTLFDGNLDHLLAMEDRGTSA